MIIQENIINFPIYSIRELEETPELCLFFDIETTGLSWKRSHLYLMGAIFFENNQWIKKLWFCQKPAEESEVLKEILTAMKDGTSDSEIEELIEKAKEETTIIAALIEKYFR